MTESGFTGRELQPSRLPREVWKPLLLGDTQGTPGQVLSSLVEGDSAQGGGSGQLPDLQTCSVVLAPCEAGLGVHPLGVGALHGMSNLTWDVFPADPLWRNKSADVGL